MVENPLRDKIAPWYFILNEERDGAWPLSCYLPYCFDRFKKRTQDFPLTMDKVNKFLDDYVKRPISMSKEYAGGYMFPRKNPYNWVICLGLKQSKHEIGISLVHEVIHGYYRCRGFTIFSDDVQVEEKRALLNKSFSNHTLDHEVWVAIAKEKLIDKLSKRFYYVNNKAVDELAAKLIEEKNSQN